MVVFRIGLPVSFSIQKRAPPKSYNVGQVGVEDGSGGVGPDCDALGPTIIKLKTYNIRHTTYDIEQEQEKI